MLIALILLAQTDDPVLEELARRQGKNGGWGVPQAEKAPDEPTRRAVDQLLAKLEGSDIDGREEAVVKLAAIGRPAVGQLRRSMESGDAELKARCVEALERIDADVEATAVALLSFMGRGWTHLHVKWKEPMRNGLKWLAQRAGETGCLSEDPKAQCLGTLAFLEEFRRTRRDLMKPAAERMLGRVRLLEPEDPRTIAWQVLVIRAGESAGLGEAARSLERIEERLETKKGAAALAARVLIADHGLRSPGRHRLEALYRMEPSRLDEDELLFARLAVVLGEGWPANSRDWLQRADLWRVVRPPAFGLTFP
jgi:hypothetical protein